MEYHYTAIVLGKKDTGESDRRYTLLTKEQGILSARASGVRKSGARLAAALETATRCRLAIQRSRGAGTITQAMSEDIFPHIHGSETALHEALRVCSLVRRLTPADIPDLRTFDLLSEYLKLTDHLAGRNNPDKIDLLTAAVMFRLFAHAGYSVETSSCAAGRHALAGQAFCFSAAHGGVLCESCGRSVAKAFLISRNVLKLMRLSAAQSLSGIMKIAVPHRDLRMLRTVAEAFSEWTLSS